MPLIPNEFPELQQLSEAQLQRLLNDDVAFAAHVDRLARTDVMIRSIEELRAKNQATCEEHITKVRNTHTWKEPLLL